MEIHWKVRLRGTLVLTVLGAAVLVIGNAQPPARGGQEQVYQVSGGKPEAAGAQKRQLAMNTARQKEITDDTAKLLALANELKAEMDKSTKDTLSLAVVRKAEQIEKLAHAVREKMKASIGN